MGDPLGRDVTHGYGSVLVPCQPGHSEHSIDMYSPMASSFAQRVLNAVTGTYPEYFDSTFVAQGSNREVTRTQATGLVQVHLQVATRDMQRFGYVSSSANTSQPLN